MRDTKRMDKNNMHFHSPASAVIWRPLIFSCLFWLQ